MMWEKIVQDYFVFSRKDRIGILVIVSLIVALFILPKTLSKKRLAAIDDNTLAEQFKNLETHEKSQFTQSTSEENNAIYQFDKRSNSKETNAPIKLFPFDPNTITDVEWKRLGLRDKTIRTIRNYLNKGGQFRKPADVQKIYGLFPDEYTRLEPFIKIEEKNRTHPYSTELNATNTTYTNKENRYNNLLVDINTADSTALIALPGIGSKLAGRILNFRSKLGGFYSIAQVAEIYGLPDSTFQKIKKYLILENTSLNKININTASIEELKAHPYIKWKIANPLVNYRVEHGPFKNIEDVKKIMVIDNETYEKIAPYLTLQ